MHVTVLNGDPTPDDPQFERAKALVITFHEYELTVTEEDDEAPSVGRRVHIALKYPDGEDLTLEHCFFSKMDGE